MAQDIEAVRQLDRHLRSPRQVWLVGAGISYDAGLPLMYPLTNRIYHLLDNDVANADARDLVRRICSDLPDDCHIEHVLSHFGDLIALADRAKDECGSVGGERVHKDKLRETHHLILRHIRDILRWGYRPANGAEAESVGKSGMSIVDIQYHRRFIRSIYRINRAGLDERRDAIEFVTTNYDTLIEDALALELVPYADGFTGGAIGVWNEALYNKSVADGGIKAVVTKLHGSIDWYRCGAERSRVFRVRHDDPYPDRADANGNVVIYPQSTKYVASREDPFGYMFQRFRGLLAQERQQVLLICGYSFGDDHIDTIIEQHLLHPDSKTTLIAFASRFVGKLKRWAESGAGDRVFVLAKDGLYRGSGGPFFPAPVAGTERDWWTFAGAASLLENGLPADIAEVIE